FGGAVMDVGTPAEVVGRRGLSAVELEVADRRDEAEAALRADPRVEEIAHFGTTFRVIVRAGADPSTVVRAALAARKLVPRELREGRVSVEDAFVAMVRQDERRRADQASPEARP